MTGTPEEKATAPLHPGRNVSLVSRGSWGRFVVAVALISLLPTLALVALFAGPLAVSEWSAGVWGCVVAFIVGNVALGYALLWRYPKTTVKLRKYLKQIADGELPDGVELAHDENDIAAIEKYLNAILFQARWKVRTIEHQRETLLEAERQRVLIESLGSACHHVGQPATALTIQLDLLKQHATTSEQRQEIEACIATAEAVGEILDKLRKVCHYRTEPYISTSADAPDARIVSL